MISLFVKSSFFLLFSSVIDWAANGPRDRSESAIKHGGGEEVVVVSAWAGREKVNGN